MMENRVMKASEFKAKCLKLMDELNEHGGSITITKNGKPVAVLRSVQPRPRTLWGLHAGEVEILGDIISPVLEEFEAPR